jgi:hypothetical protein
MLANTKTEIAAKRRKKRKKKEAAEIDDIPSLPE